MLNDSQNAIFNEVYNWYWNSPEQVIQIEGPPGTGKTYLMWYIATHLGIELEDIMPAAYTGAAAVVLRSKGFNNAKTFHSWMYKMVKTEVLGPDGKPVMDKYYNTPIYDITWIPQSLKGIKLIIADEAGTIPIEMKADIEKHGIKIIAVGDLRQLPPVESQPAYLYSGKVLHLTEYMRQSESDGIVYVSDMLYKGLNISKGLYNNVLVIEEDELTDEMLVWADLILCGTNKTRNNLNHHIRNDIRRYTDILPHKGEKLICRNNNWNIECDGINLANGLIGVVNNYPDVSGFDGRTFELEFWPGMLDRPFKNLRVDYKYFTSDHQKKEYLKKNRFYKGELFEYADVITTHLSQGSEARRGIYVQEYIHKDINNHLDYTGLTRFKQNCIVVIRKKKYYFN